MRWLVQHQSWRRLGSEIEAFELALRSRGDATLAPQIGRALQRARDAHEAGDIDQGWKCLQAAQRLELLTLKDEDLPAAALVIKKEASKLRGWRKEAVEELLTPKDCGAKLTKERVLRAALLRDEHYGNEAYRDGLRRSNAVGLAIALFVALGCLFAMLFSAPLPGGQDETLSRFAYVAVMGLIGAIVSAITRMPDPQTRERIPQVASSSRIMFLRILMGPASAIVIYFVMQSGLKFGETQLDAKWPDAVLVISFVAGFSERLVMRVVDSIAKSTPEAPDRPPQSERKA